MTSSLNQQVDQMVLLTQYYPGIYTQVVPEQGSEVKLRKRRKKSKGEGSTSGFRKRKLTDEQVNMLEVSFCNEHKLESERKDKLASELGLDPRQVAVWFQNRRARWKSKKVVEEYSKLKSENENTVVENCQLRTEVLQLKERLSEAQMEIQRLSERSDGGSSNSPSSSFSREFIEPPFMGEFGMDGLENVFCAPGNYYGIHDLENLSNLYM